MSEDTSVEIVSGDAIMSMEKAQIDIQISTAKQYPRNVLKVKNDMLTMATLDEDTAAACFYSLPRGGKQIEGGSVRMAEIALAAYGNVKAGTRIIAVHTGENPHAVVQSAVIDLQNNVAYTVEKRRRITSKKNRDGTRKPVDDDDIQLAVNAGSAIAFRDAVFKIVPRALINPVLAAAKSVAVGDVKSLAVKRDKVVARLKQMGVTEDRIFAAIEVRKIDEIDADKLATLIGAGQSIRDGATLEDVFPPIAPPDPPASSSAPFTKTANTAPPTPLTTPPPAKQETNVQPPTDPAPTQVVTQQPDPKSPQELLEILVGSVEGATWESFRAWVVGAGFLKADSVATGFSELGVALCSKLLKNPAGLQAALKQ